MFKSVSIFGLGCLAYLGLFHSQVRTSFEQPDAIANLRGSQNSECYDYFWYVCSIPQSACGDSKCDKGTFKDACYIYGDTLYEYEPYNNTYWTMLPAPYNQYLNRPPTIHDKCAVQYECNYSCVNGVNGKVCVKSSFFNYYGYYSTFPDTDPYLKCKQIY